VLIESENKMYHLKQGRWDQLQQDAKLIRTQVFIVEQHIPEAEEWDDHDAISQHFVIYEALLHKDLKCKAPLIEPNLRRNLGKWST